MSFERIGDRLKSGKEGEEAFESFWKANFEPRFGPLVRTDISGYQSFADYYNKPLNCFFEIKQKNTSIAIDGVYLNVKSVFNKFLNQLTDEARYIIVVHFASDDKFLMINLNKIVNSEKGFIQFKYPLLDKSLWMNFQNNHVPLLKVPVEDFVDMENLKGFSEN